LRLHLSGGLVLAGTPERWRWLRSELAWLHAQGIDATEVSPHQAAEMVPIIDPKGLAGAIFDPLEGNLDANGTTYAYAAAARKRGAEILTHDRVHTLERTADGWRLETDRGPVEAEHVVNAAGLWARRVGRSLRCPTRAIGR
jgi:dimethylglycine dehydrogenase